MRIAIRKPAPEAIANAGLTCALVPLVVSGTVAGVDSRPFSNPSVVVVVAGDGVVGGGT
jgi:hypothetical protein